jgi:hypothetical protein
MPVQSDPFVKRALWPALVLAVLAYVVVDFVQHPFLGVPSDAAVVPEAHLTLWLAQTEAAGEAAATVHETADGLLLHGHPATVGVLAGGSSQAVVHFFSSPRSPEDLLAVSSGTLADLAQERTSTFVGEDPMRAALAQHLLARAIPVGLLNRDPLTIAVPRDSPIHSVGELLGELRASPQRHVFAITDGSWAADNLAALVQDAGIEGYVPYRIFPSTEEATLALAAGSADVVLAPHGTILPELRARTLRALRWPATAGGAPSSWIELFAVRGTSPAQVARLRRQLLALTRDPAWRALLRRGGQAPAAALSSLRLRSFLPAQMQRAAGLQQLALHAARHSYEAGGEA